MAKKVLIFGGGFNPPTLAHEAIIAACLKLPGFDEVWLMPSGNRRDKTMRATDDDRLRMAQIVRAKRFGSDRRLRVTDFELNLPRPTETYHTARALAKTWPGTEFSWVFGSDSYYSMPTWSHGARLRQTLDMQLVERDTPLPSLGVNRHLLQPEYVCPPVSSTQARQAIALGMPVDAMLSQPIADYIAAHRLYR